MAEVEAPPAPAPALPDYVTDPNAVTKDTAAWRYGRAPDYSNTRKVWAATKVKNHKAGSLEEIVENLVKNWEIEASFKQNVEDWRTVDHSKYTFAINGGPPQDASVMLKVGTYNAIIAAGNEYYDPAHSDFNSSHKTFKRMMPTFAWEVMEVYSGPPVVAFKWRHWGVMKNDYVGFNNKSEKVTAKAHGGLIEIFGVTVANVNDKLQVEKLDTWFDPIDMFRQIAPTGVVVKDKVAEDACVDFGKDEHDGVDFSEPNLSAPAMTDASGATENQAPTANEAVGACPYIASVTGNLDQSADLPAGQQHRELPAGHPPVSGGNASQPEGTTSQQEGSTSLPHRPA